MTTLAVRSRLAADARAFRCILRAHYAARLRVRPSPMSAAPNTNATSAPSSIPRPLPVNGNESPPLGVVGPSTVEPCEPLGAVVELPHSTDVLDVDPNIVVDGEMRILVVVVFGLNSKVVSVV